MRTPYALEIDKWFEELRSGFAEHLPKDQIDLRLLYVPDSMLCVFARLAHRAAAESYWEKYLKKIRKEREALNSRMLDTYT